MNIRKRKIRIIEWSVLIAFTVTCFLSTVSFAHTCDDIRDSVLRMHIIANSDSEEDQELKLKVRDAVLEAGKECFDSSLTLDQALEKLIPEKAELKKVAEDVIRENGYDYSVDIKIENTFFSTKTYDDVTLPAGEYLAVNVVIGEGEGHNWWCVMFPPMCLPAAESEVEIEDVLTDSEIGIVKSNPKYEPRFKIVELYEKFIKNY